MSDRDTSRDKWWWAAAIFAALAVGALVIVVTVGPGDSDPQAQPAPSAPHGSTRAEPPASTPGGGSERPPGCHTAATNKAVPHAAPKNIEWELVDGMAVPTSATAGPTLHDGAATYCYAHTPTGALLAAWNIPQRLNADRAASPAEQIRQVYQHSIVPSKYARQLKRRAIASAGSGGSSSGAGSADSGQVAGYKFISYTPQAATLAIVARFPGHQGAYQAQTVTLRWYQGDWRYQIHAGPRLAATVSYPNSLADYVPFSGVS